MPRIAAASILGCRKALRIDLYGSTIRMVVAVWVDSCVAFRDRPGLTYLHAGASKRWSPGYHWLARVPYGYPAIQGQPGLPDPLPETPTWVSQKGVPSPGYP